MGDGRRLRDCEMKIIVATRCSWNHCLGEESLFAWTLYTDDGSPLARSEYAWKSKGSAQNAARAFRKAIGRPDIMIKTAGQRTKRLSE